MRRGHLILGVIAFVGLAFAPASARAVQRGAHPAIHAHTMASAHPVKTVKAASHPTPVSVPQRIANNPALATRLQPLLPSGMTLASAASGFKNQGQFIAALHVSRNLNIPFAQLKAEMTGTDHDSLGQAIHDLQPAKGSAGRPQGQASKEGG